MPWAGLGLLIEHVEWKRPRGLQRNVSGHHLDMWGTSGDTVELGIP